MGKDDIEELRVEIIENAIIVEPKEKIDVIEDDPDDNKILEAAVEGEVDYIVSGGIRIVSPAGLIEILNRLNRTKHSGNKS